MNKRLVGIIIILALCSCLIFSSCDAELVGAVGSNGPNHAQESYHYFNGTNTFGISTSAGKTIDFTYSSAVKSGTLSIQILDPSKTAVSNLTAGTSGTTADPRHKPDHGRAGLCPEQPLLSTGKRDFCRALELCRDRGSEALFRDEQTGGVPEALLQGT